MLGHADVSMVALAVVTGKTNVNAATASKIPANARIFVFIFHFTSFLLNKILGYYKALRKQ